MVLIKVNIRKVVDPFVVIISIISLFRIINHKNQCHLKTLILNISIHTKKDRMEISYLRKATRVIKATKVWAGKIKLHKERSKMTTRELSAILVIWNLVNYRDHIVERAPKTNNQEQTLETLSKT